MLQGCGGSQGTTTTTMAPCTETCPDDHYCSPYLNKCAKPAPVTDVLNMCSRDAGCTSTGFTTCDVGTASCVSEGKACNARCTSPTDACSGEEVCAADAGRCLTLTAQWCTHPAAGNDTAVGNECEQA